MIHQQLLEAARDLVAAEVLDRQDRHGFIAEMATFNVDAAAAGLQDPLGGAFVWAQFLAALLQRPERPAVEDVLSALNGAIEPALAFEGGAFASIEEARAAYDRAVPG